MFIHRLRGQAFEPEAIEVMATAFDRVLNALSLVDRNDPLTEIVAKRVIEVARGGERDASHLAQRVLLLIRDFDKRG